MTDARLGSRVADPAKTPRAHPGDRPTGGRQCHAQHPAQERTGLPCADPAAPAYTPSACLGGRQAQRPQPADPARCEVHAYVSGSRNDDRTLLTDQVDLTGDVGLDVKWGVRADLTLDATVNTDFAQVEADEEQVNLTRFRSSSPRSGRSSSRTRRPFSSASRRRLTCSSRAVSVFRSLVSRSTSWPADA